MIERFVKQRISSTNLVPIILKSTKSIIVQNNNHTIYCSKYENMRGLFRKDMEDTRKFGRYVCDTVKKIQGNEGFFTTDEIPRYGISKNELNIILDKTSAGTNDLVIIFAYELSKSIKTKEILDKILEKILI